MTRDELRVVVKTFTRADYAYDNIMSAIDEYTVGGKGKPGVSGTLPGNEDDGWMYCPNCGRVKIQD